MDERGAADGGAAAHKAAAPRDTRALGRAIRRRLRHGDVTALAAAVGRNRSTVRYWLAGEHAIPAAAVPAIAAFLGVSEAGLLAEARSGEAVAALGPVPNTTPATAAAAREAALTLRMVPVYRSGSPGHIPESRLYPPPELAPVLGDDGFAVRLVGDYLGGLPLPDEQVGLRAGDLCWVAPDLRAHVRPGSVVAADVLRTPSGGGPAVPALVVRVYLGEEDGRPVLAVHRPGQPRTRSRAVGVRVRGPVVHADRPLPLA